MQWSDTRIAVAGDKECRGILFAFYDVVVWRIRAQIAELRRVFGTPVLGNPVRAVHEFLIPKHVFQWIAADDRLKKLRPLRQRRTDQQSPLLTP